MYNYQFSTPKGILILSMFYAADDVENEQLDLCLAAAASGK
jgi:hypothetical protein